MSARWSAVDLRGVPLYWVATVTLAGRPRYYATEALSITSSVVAGGSVATEATLQPVSLRKQGASFGGTPEARTARITVLPVESPGVWIAEGHVLEGQPCEIALWRAGDTWEQRRVQLRGVIRGASWGAAGSRWSWKSRRASSQTGCSTPRRGWSSAPPPGPTPLPLRSACPTR